MYLIQKRSPVQSSVSNEAVRHGGLTIIVPRPTNILSIRDRSEQCVILERFATNVSRGRVRSVGHLNLLLAKQTNVHDCCLVFTLIP